MWDPKASRLVVLSRDPILMQRNILSLYYYLKERQEFVSIHGKGIFDPAPPHRSRAHTHTYTHSLTRPHTHTTLTA